MAANGHTTIGYEDGDEYEYEYEYEKGRKPSGRRVKHGYRCGYSTNGEVVVEDGCKKRIFDRRGCKKRYKTGTKRVRSSWGSHDDDIAQAVEDAVHGYKLYMDPDSDNDLPYEDEEWLFIASENATEDSKKSFGDNSSH